MSASEHRDLGRWSRWLTAWTALGLPGFCVALVMWGAVTVVGIAAAVAVPIALMLLLTDHGHRQWDSRPSTSVGVGWIIRVMVCGIVVVFSVTALGAVVPALGFLIFAFAAASTPLTADMRKRLVGHTPTQHHPASAKYGTPLPLSATVDPVPDAATRSMTDAQLCRAWRHSYWLLREAPDQAVRLAIVRTRRELLDELENRNPAALEAWLASGPRPSQGPDQFLGTKECGDEPTAA